MPDFQKKVEKKKRVKKKSSKLTEKELFSSCVLEKAGKYDKSY
jgi:hypothetical protein